MVLFTLAGRAFLTVMCASVMLAPGGAHSAPSHPAGGAGDLAPANIIRIDGAAEGDHAGDPVADAGDVNGDGRLDVLVGTCRWIYAVFGQRASTTTDLARLGSRGFRIDTRAACWLGEEHDAAGAGDVNGDGRADVIIGADWASNNGREYSGSAYVVFGKASPKRVDLAALGARGFRIDGAEEFDSAGDSVAGVRAT